MHLLRNKFLAILSCFLIASAFVSSSLPAQAVVPTTNSTSTATGDGVTNTFTFTFELLQASDMTVYVNSVLQTQSTNYIVNPTGGSYPCTGGTITFQTGFTPPALAVILMTRQLTLTQTISLPVEGSLPSSTLQTVFDRACMQIQQINTNQLLSLQLPITSIGVNTALPTPVALNLFGWDSLAQNVVNYTPQQIVANITGVGLGNVIGASGTTVNYIPVWNNTLGTGLATGIAPSTAGYVLTSNGPSSLASFQALATIPNNTYAARAVNANPPPTSGTLTGEYWTSGNWATTGACTFNNVRLHVGGTVTISNPITVNTELTSGGGLAGNAVTRVGTGAGTIGSGVGGSYGGQGGTLNVGAGLGSLASSTYSIDKYLGGSAGSPGDLITALGGGAGGGTYIESVGNVSITANITANGGNGAAGTNIASGAGSGGAIDIRSLGTVTISAAATLSAQGGTGGGGSTYSGGGGGGGCIRARGTTVTNSGTVTVAGGAAGTGGTLGTAGGTGYTDITSTTLGPRSN
jgi:hypothetical protein